MSTGPDWTSIVAAAVAVGGAVVTVVLWVPGKIAKVYEAITASRHKAASDLVPRFAGIDEDIDELRKDLNALGQRVARLEAMRGRA